MKKLLLIILVLIVPSTAMAEVVITVQKEYYAVPGTTKHELLRNMEAYAPERKGDYYVPAFTLPQIQYRYELKGQNGRCYVSRVEIHLNLVYRYPKLAQTPTSDYVKRWWDELVQRYVIHEEIHGEIAINGAHEMERELLSLDDLNCDVAHQEVENRAAFLAREMQRDQEDYDRQTRHGMQQENY